MDPHNRAEDVLLCQLCEASVSFLYCNINNVHRCKDCVGEHPVYFTKGYSTAFFQKRGSTAKCLKHNAKICELYCKYCDIPICVQCAYSKEHQGHTFVDIVRDLEEQKYVLENDLQELEKSIFPKFQEIESFIKVQKADLNENSQKLTTAIDKTGKDLYSEIDVIIEKLKSNLNEIDSRNLAVLAKYEQEITHNISEITESIADLKELLKSNDINIVSSYKSRNALFRKLPPKPSVTLPGFTPCKINKEHISQQFGSLSELFNRTEENDYTIDVPGAEYSPPGRIFLDVPQIITEINTGYKNIFSVACLSDEDLWICGNGNVLKLYNLQRGLVRSYPTKSGLLINGNAITSNGDPVFIDYCGKTVNLVKNSQRHTIIKQKGWIPLSVCSTSSDDLLVVLASDDIKQETKVVRYSDSTEKQSIQYNDKGKPLYSSGGCSKCINENRNLDICVSDWRAPAVVVVNQAGKLRFTYNGPPFPTMESFDPQSITTDSQSRILIADCKNHYIHILDQDGQFLQFIDNYELLRPVGLCVDTNDNLFVGESCTGKLKKIQYYL